MFTSTCCSAIAITISRSNAMRAGVISTFSSSDGAGVRVQMAVLIACISGMRDHFS